MPRMRSKVTDHVTGDVGGGPTRRIVQRATKAMACGLDAEYGAASPGSVDGDDPLAAWRVAPADLMAALDPAALARLVRVLGADTAG